MRVAVLAVLPRVIRILKRSHPAEAQLPAPATTDQRVEEPAPAVENTSPLRKAPTRRWLISASVKAESPSLSAWCFPTSVRAPPFAGAKTRSRVYLHRRSFPINSVDPSGLDPRTSLLNDVRSLVGVYGDPTVSSYLNQWNESNGYLRWREDQPSTGVKGWSNSGSLVVNLNTAALGVPNDKTLQEWLNAKNSCGPDRPNSASGRKRKNYERLLLNVADTLYHEVTHTANGERWSPDEPRTYRKEVDFLKSLLDSRGLTPYGKATVNGLMDDALSDALQKGNVQIPDPRR